MRDLSAADLSAYFLNVSLLRLMIDVFALVAHLAFQPTLMDSRPMLAIKANIEPTDVAPSGKLVMHEIHRPALIDRARHRQRE
jgi:hypothetical protein